MARLGELVAGLELDREKVETSFSVNSQHLPPLNVGITCFKCRQLAED